MKAVIRGICVVVVVFRLVKVTYLVYFLIYYVMMEQYNANRHFIKTPLNSVDFLSLNPDLMKATTTRILLTEGDSSTLPTSTQYNILNE
jgi:hypothetical protein